MSKSAASWERYGRRFTLRLSQKKEDERAILDEYDRRSQLLGTEDKDFLRNCLIAGFRVLTGRIAADVCAAMSVQEPPAVDHVERAIVESTRPTAFPQIGVSASSSHSSPDIPENPEKSEKQDLGSLRESTEKAAHRPVSSRELLGGLMNHS